ncbi:MAG TPA: GspH/FimT family pseudopilin [Planctomycetota bacterium]|nr:GspH/FimT family pseudopilin [Planctomycetota bacterium]
MHPNCGTASFTLVELIIVVLIVSILAAVGIPAISEASADLRLRSAAQRLMADLNYARNLAITDGTSYGISFSGNSYRVIKFVDTSVLTSEANTVIAHPLSRQPWVVSFSGERTTCAADFSGGSIVYYDSTGSPNAAGTVVLRHGGLAVTVSVEAGTGRVTVQTGGG